MNVCKRHPNGSRYESPSNPDRCLECKIELRQRHYDLRGRSMSERYGAARAVAARRGVPFTITLAQYTTLVSRPCVYAIQEEQDIRIGLDQSQPGQGYTPTNSLPCCAKHNEIKGAHGTFEQARDIVRMYGQRCGNSAGGRKKSIRTRPPYLVL